MKVPRRKFLHLAVGATALSALPDSVVYPARPVRIVVGFPAGGPTDIFARLMGQWLSQRPISASSSSTTQKWAKVMYGANIKAE
jgi:tripartite-type tricarboxylate transporter receptor subunit TctC